MKKSMIIGAVALVVAGVSQAAVINWDTSATNISGDTDVSLNGDAFWAYNLGFASSTTTTVNGVEFVGSDKNSKVTEYLTRTSTGSNNKALGSTEGTFVTLSASYQDLLKSATYGGGYTYTMTSLTVDQEYEIQIWSNVSGSATENTTTIVGTDPARTLDWNTTDAVGGVGQFIKGTFVADATSQEFELSQTDLNVIQLRAIPEPATIGLVTAFGAGILFVRRRLCM
jgi:hypothetical protein